MSDTAFPEAAARALRDTQLRHNLGEAARTIRARRATVVDERVHWEVLRELGRQIKDEALESEGNGRMCTTLPRVLITVMGIEKVLPRSPTWR